MDQQTFELITNGLDQVSTWVTRVNGKELLELLDGVPWQERAVHARFNQHALGAPEEEVLALLPLGDAIKAAYGTERASVRLYQQGPGVLGGEMQVDIPPSEYYIVLTSTGVRVAGTEFLEISAERASPETMLRVVGIED